MSIIHVAFYPSDWLAGTRGLSDAETGVYITLICRMYEMAGPIERDDNRLARLCGAKSKQSFVKSLKYLISEGKIIEQDGELFNERAQKEIKNTTGKSVKAKTAAQSRWNRKPNKNNGSDNADAPSEHSSSICQSESEPITTLPSASANVTEDKINLMLDALGITDETKSVGLLQWSEPIRWLENGCDIEKDIIPTLKQMATRGKLINSWSYCSQAIFDAKARREAPPPDVTAVSFNGYQNQETAVDKAYRAAKELKDARAS